MSTTPTPLPAHSPKLRNRRYQVEILVRHATRAGSWMSIATGRFVNVDDAHAWADAVHADAERVNVTFLSARTGWRPQSSGHRIAGVWS
jgi:hypothetical protein